MQDIVLDKVFIGKIADIEHSVIQIAMLTVKRVLH